MENNQSIEQHQLIRAELLKRLESLKSEIDSINYTQMERILKIYGALNFMKDSVEDYKQAIQSHERRLQLLEDMMGMSGSVGMGQTAEPQVPQNPQAPAQAAQEVPPEPPESQVQAADYQLKTQEQVQNNIGQIRAKAENALHRQSYPQASRPPR